MSPGGRRPISRIAIAGGRDQLGKLPRQAQAYRMPACGEAGRAAVASPSQVALSCAARKQFPDAFRGYFMAKIEDRAPPSAASLNDDIGEAKRLAMYRTQVVIREAEQRAYDLFLQNLVKGTSHLSLGQEAVAAGFAAAMRPGDLSPSAPIAAMRTRLARGVPIDKVLGELMQRDIGLMRGKGGSMHLTSVDHGVMGSYAIIGAHLPIACGAAWRAQYKGDKDVSVCFFGDGTTNIGAFHEALNFAAVWKLPVIFVCENNLYMEYTPIADVTAVPHPAADRAAAYGLPRIVIDGNDADDVYRTALLRLRQGARRRRPLPDRMPDLSPQRPLARRPRQIPAGGRTGKAGRSAIRSRSIANGSSSSASPRRRSSASSRRETAKSTKRPRHARRPRCRALDILTTDVYADGGFAWRN